MATKNTKANRANGTKAAETKAGKKASPLHIAMAGSKKSLCGARGKTAPATEASCPECKRIADHAAARLLEGAGGAAGTSARGPTTAAAGTADAGNASGATTKRHKANAAATKASGPAERDPRLPPVGTVIKKLDRHAAVRCEAKVVEGGIEYKGEVFKSLSGAACAAAKDLGINGQQNGFVFWGITRPEAKAKNPVQAIEKVWERYSARVKAIAGVGLDAGTRKQVAELLDEHRTKIAEASGAFEEAE
jgi:hypothetical protein